MGGIFLPCPAEAKMRQMLKSHINNLLGFLIRAGCEGLINSGLHCGSNENRKLKTVSCSFLKA